MAGFSGLKGLLMVTRAKHCLVYGAIQLDVRRGGTRPAAFKKITSGQIKSGSIM